MNAGLRRHPTPFHLSFVFRRIHHPPKELSMTTMNPHITERRRNPERRSGTDQSMARHFGAVDWLAMVLMMIGGINWGLVGLMNVDLVAVVFGDGSTAARVVYALVGLAALYSIYTLSKLASDNQR
jgi:uncharacterized membrane protein YuzA (DUF378 family)